MLLQASTQIIAILKTYPNMLVSKKRLNEILNIPSENNGNTLLKKIDSVKLEDFSFSYNSKKIFEHFNYEFHKGNIYLIKGKNGVGKTTLINNILGLYIESYGGDILYNNYSIISKMELEMSEPKASQLLEMAKYFNVSVDYILCNSDYKYIQEVYHNAKNIEVENIDFIKMYKNLSESDKELIYALAQRLSKVKTV